MAATKVRPTLEQIKAAMAWWNAKPQPEQGELRREILRREDRLTRGSLTVGATDITRYWISINSPEPNAEDPSK
jgi:hypothetical protein